jgi:hypothetical protein
MRFSEGLGLLEVSESLILALEHFNPHIPTEIIHTQKEIFVTA